MTGATFLTLWAIVPWSVFVLQFIFAPGYTGTLLKQPAGIALTLATMLWQGLGIFLISRTASVGLRVVIAIFFITPVLLLPMFGPALVTILQALGPVVGN